MPTIFEVFGFPVADRTQQAETVRQSRLCPFMGEICDGGGNRYQTKIKLTSQEPLSDYFHPDITEVIPGICSIQAGNDIWVVCPRRLFSAKCDAAGIPAANRALQQHESDLLIHAGLPKGVEIGVWSEVSLKHRVDDGEINYQFDYLLAPLVPTSLSQLPQKLLETHTKDDLGDVIKSARKNGYYPAEQKSADVVIPLPDLDQLFILEVMTASTSGSDSEKSTDIRSAFRNYLLGAEHTSPGINKRQVWGRMVSQLFAKTALAKEWKGQTIWVIQDSLLHNLELTTRLNTKSLPSNPQRNISLVVMEYRQNAMGTKEIADQTTINGDAGIDFAGSHTFTDILLPKFAPPKIELLKAIMRRKLAAILNL